MSKTTKLPPIVAQAEWQPAHERLLAKEKAARRGRDARAAERRRQPMVPIDKSYALAGPTGKARLLDLFEGSAADPLSLHVRAGAHDWPDAGCDGCSMFVDQVGHLAHLHARDTSFALVSVAPLPNIERYRKRMGWTIPWFSSAGSDFNRDFGVTTQAGEMFALSVFLREGTTSWPAGGVGSLTQRVAAKRALYLAAPP